MSQETSPGMRALEAMDFYVFHHGLRLAGLPKDRDTARKEIAAIIERETGVTELQCKVTDLADDCFHLRQQADELAKALDELMNGVRESWNEHDGCSPSLVEKGVIALDAYRKDKP